MVKKVQDNLTIEEARIGFRNFSGTEGQFNAAGDRNFVVFLTPEQADEYAELGWTIKSRPPREEGEEPLYFMKVKIKFSEKARPPRIVMIGSRGRQPLSEELLDILDWADIEKSDMILRPYNWDIRGQQGVSAYCVSLYVTIREDVLELKYADVPLAIGSGPVAIESQVLLGELVDEGEINEQFALTDGR